MTLFTQGNPPGFDTALESHEAQVWWSGPNGQDQRSEQKIQLLANETDSGNTPTSTIRAGNLIAVEDGSDDNAYIYDSDGVDGKQVAVGVLPHTQDMLVDNTSTTRFTRMLTTGLLKANELVGLDAQAKAQLIRQGFRFDNREAEGAGFLVHSKGVYRKTADYTVTAADNGKKFVAAKGSAMTFTLPTIAAGLSFEFLQSVAQNMVIDGASNILAKGNATADKLTFSTASEKIGAHVRLRAIYVNTTLKWSVEELSTCTMTVS